MKYPDTPLQRHLARLEACAPAREWAGRKSAKDAWQKCTNPYWLLWWAGETKVNDFEIVSSALGLFSVLEIRKLLKQPWTEPKPKKRAPAKKRKSG